jgi:hypothetical protein
MRLHSTLSMIDFGKSKALLSFRSFFTFSKMPTILPIASATHLDACKNLLTCRHFLMMTSMMPTIPAMPTHVPTAVAATDAMAASLSPRAPPALADAHLLHLFRDETRPQKQLPLSSGAQEKRPGLSTFAARSRASGASAGAHTVCSPWQKVC